VLPKFVFCDVTRCRLVNSTIRPILFLDCLILKMTTTRSLEPSLNFTIWHGLASGRFEFFLQKSFDLSVSKFLPINQSYSCFHFLRSSKTSNRPFYLEAFGSKGNCIEKKRTSIWLAELILRNDKAHSYTTLSFVKAVFGVQRGRHIEGLWHKFIYIGI
jgi:hypothetical protein